MSMQATCVSSFCVFLAFVRSFMLKVLLPFARLMQRSSSVSVEEQGQSLPSSYRDETEDSVFLQSGGLISNTVSAEAVSEPMKETETVGSKELDQRKKVSEESRQGFQFKFPFDSYSFPSDDRTETDEVRSEKLKLDSDEIKNSVMEYVEDISYEVELNPMIMGRASACDDAVDSDSDDDYIVFEQRKVLLPEEDDPMNRDDDDDEDVLKEHQDLVRQMKMELKNFRIKGLPTISEEHGSPKMFDDLKPFKAERKFEYEDAVDELRKFHKIYAEKMRKLDVLNYQALHAISFIELTDKEAGKPRSKKRTSKFDKRKIYADSSHRPISEMHHDLELIYVGQLCLSWEILSWSYIKAPELIDYDSDRTHSYNRVSEDFQQFQVLLQRFMEDEPFQGERMACYAERRCITRNLLQVPMIRDDCYKDKKERPEEGDAISIEALLNIIRESMFVFWDFLHSDKRGTNAAAVPKSLRRNKADDEAVDSSDSRVLASAVAALRTKEKRVKESTRSQSCIIKRLKRHKEEEEGGRESDVLMKCQVDLRLASKVLSLPRLTNDQMLWCQMKLNCIGFVGRKVHVEPSFLLFPC